MFVSSGEERRFHMSTKMGFWRWALVGAALLITSAPASASRLLRAGVTTNESAAVLIFPKVVVDPDVCEPDSPESAATGEGPNDGFCSVSGEECDFTRDPENGARINDEECDDGAGIDTLIQLTNTANDFRTRALCYWINANGHCDNAPDIICTEENFRQVCPIGGLCEPSWDKTDFRFTLTKRQPISWSARDPNPDLPCDENSTEPCDNDQRNQGDLLGVPEVPFRGELICVQLVATDNPNDADIPIDRNDLKGEATIVTLTSEVNGASPEINSEATIDARKYNALGIPAVPGRVNQDQILNIGGPEAEYGAVDQDGNIWGCPNVLVVDHFFDGAEVSTHDQGSFAEVVTDLTLVPCSSDLTQPASNLARVTTLQFLVYNEFEQRFSTSTKLSCFKEILLSDIDTRPDDPEDNRYSVFWAGVQGTLTGVSHIRPVAGPNVDGYDGRGTLAITEEFWTNPLQSTVERGTHTDAANVHFRGVRTQGDRIVLP
jgi:hypothetical protein